MRKLIIRVFYISVSGLSRQQAEEQIYQLMSNYKLENDNLPEDISINYHIEDVWLPITEGNSRVEVIYPPKFEIEDLDLENIDKLINTLNEIKIKLENETR